MPIIVRKPKSTFKPAPEGLHQAVCCDVWEPWTEESKYVDGQMVEKTRIVWQLEVQDDEHDRPYEVSQVYRMSLHEKAKLYQHLKAWRGRDFTNEELAAFDIESIIGANCQIQVVHNIGSDGTVYANVQAIVPIAKSMVKLLVSEGFQRRKDREAPKQHEGAPSNGDEEVPF